MQSFRRQNYHRVVDVNSGGLCYFRRCYLFILMHGWCKGHGQWGLVKLGPIPGAAGLARWLSGKRNPPASADVQVLSQGQEDPLE